MTQNPFPKAGREVFGGKLDRRARDIDGVLGTDGCFGAHLTG